MVSAQIPPLLPPFSHSLPPSLDSFSDMPAQAHLAAHVLPPAPPFPPFTFLPCDISMATWKETSVLGEQCDGVGCSGRGGGCSGEAGGIRRVERATGVRGVPTQGDQGIAGNNILPPSELGLDGGGG